MDEIDWEGVANDAEEGMAGLLGKLERLFREGRLEMIMVGYAYRDEAGGMAHGYTFEPDNDVYAMGLWEITKARVFNVDSWQSREE